VDTGNPWQLCDVFFPGSESGFRIQCAIERSHASDVASILPASLRLVQAISNLEHPLLLKLG